MKEPIVVRSFGDEQYVGCTGCPADSHVVNWLTMSRDRPIERCPECGSVYKMDYVGPQESHDAHGHHGANVGRMFPSSTISPLPHLDTTN
jgi:cytochrome c oxidase subunit 5b